MHQKTTNSACAAFVWVFFGFFYLIFEELILLFTDSQRYHGQLSRILQERKAQKQLIL